jgi:hypothetical protein
VVVAATAPVEIATAMRDAPDLATHLQGGGFDFAFAELPATATNVLVLPGPDHSTGFGLPRPSG